MRDLMKALLRFPWAMSLFGASTASKLLVPQDPRQPQDEATVALDVVTSAAERQIADWLKPMFETGEQLQSEMVDLMFGKAPTPQAATADTPMQPPSRAAAPPGGGKQRRPQPRPQEATATFSVQLSNTTQGPFWPPSEIVDQDGNFIVVGGFILTEVAPGKIVPIPNDKGVIVSKDTLPPLQNGQEDFSNPLGAPYHVVRTLDLSPDGKDWDLTPYTVSCGPFLGDFGGGRPRIPGTGDSAYNLNANPRWNTWIAPVGAESPTYYRPSYALHQVPVWRLTDIPEYIPIGIPVDPGTTSLANGVRSGGTEFRERRPITLREYLRGRGEIKITLLRASGAMPGFTHARFDFTLAALLPNAVYAIWALRPVTLLPPTDPHFLLPVPLAIPNVVLTDSRGNAAVSYEIRNPFPNPATDAQGTRVIAVAVTYLSDFQNWGAALTSIGTGANGHTAMSGNLSALTDVMTVELSG